MKNKDQLPIKAKIFAGFVIASGLSLIVYSCAYSLIYGDPLWLFLAAATAVSGAFTVRLPVVKAKVQSITLTISDAFIFAGILLFSPEVAVTLTVIDGISATFRAYKSRSTYRIAFNFSQLGISTFVVGKVFYNLQGESPPLQLTLESGFIYVLANLALCALLHFILNSGLISIMVSLTSGQSIKEIFSENLLWASLTNVIGAGGAVLIYFSFHSAPVIAVAVTIPFVVVIYYLAKLNLNRMRFTRRHLEELDDLYQATVTSLAMAIDAKDQSTHGHVQEVKAMVLKVAEIYGMKDEDLLKGLRAAALLHDIGKLAVPEYILNKPGKLTESEMAKIRIHPSVGGDILETIPFPYEVASYVRHHHERWDGNGYPDGLKGEEIPIGARILAVVDCYAALRSDRPYRAQLSRDLALSFMRQESGKAFDPVFVNLLLENIEEIEAEGQSIREAGLPRVLEEIEHSPAYTYPGQKEIAKTVFHNIASSHREMQAVFEISQAIGKSLSVSDTMSLLSSKIKRFVPYAACAIYLVNSNDDRVLPYSVTGMFKEILEGIEIKLGEGVTGWVAANDEPLANLSPEADFPNIEVLKSVFKSCMSVPLTLDSHVVGVITLYSDRPEIYSEAHLKMMESIAPHSAAAINNAIIYEETQEDAFTDPLTELPNLRYFSTFFEEELKRARRLGYPVTILMLDLEKFKSVNDQYGHKIGDRVLVEVARIITQQLRKSDICLRYGGDEFLAILPAVDKSLARQTVHRIQRSFDERGLLRVGKKDIKVGISVGVSTFPSDGLEPDLLVAIADRRMYQNKISRTRKGSRSSVLPFDRRDIG
jgi:diguanylate cyclase (GGDEF)-like protein/putative nucleotidyltransferase with HDIG domain